MELAILEIPIQHLRSHRDDLLRADASRARLLGVRRGEQRGGDLRHAPPRRAERAPVRPPRVRRTTVSPLVLFLIAHHGAGQVSDADG